MTYPKPTNYECPECKSPVEQDESVRSYPDQDGDPVEDVALVHLCTNTDCPYHNKPLEHDFDTLD